MSGEAARFSKNGFVPPSSNILHLAFSVILNFARKEKRPRQITPKVGSVSMADGVSFGLFEKKFDQTATRWIFR
jgi:hypothetical protein